MRTGKNNDVLQTEYGLICKPPVPARVVRDEFAFWVKAVGREGSNRNRLGIAYVNSRMSVIVFNASSLFVSERQMQVIRPFVRHDHSTEIIVFGGKFVQQERAVCESSFGVFPDKAFRAVNGQVKACNIFQPKIPKVAVC